MTPEQREAIANESGLGLYMLLKAACDEAGGQAAWATRHGISPTTVNDTVNDTLNARRPVGPSILAALGLQKVTRYAAVRSFEGESYAS